MPPREFQDHDRPEPRLVDLDATTVAVGIDGRTEAWRAVADLVEAGPDDAVFTLDPDTGHVRFGDGTHGRRPPAEAIVQVRFGDGRGAAGNVGDLVAAVGGFDFGFEPTPMVATPPGQIRQIMPADGWFAVERRAAGERLVALVGWALLDRYVPPYRNGNEPPLVTTESVRGLIAPGGRPVRIVDELSALFGGYRQA